MSIGGGTGIITPGFSPFEPLPVTVIGVRTEGTGAVIPNGQVITTPDHQPNLVVQVIRPSVAVLVRAGNVFLNTLLGGLGLTIAGTQVQSLAWASWKGALVIAASAAIVNTIQSLVTIFGDLEKKHPLLTGSI